MEGIDKVVSDMISKAKVASDDAAAQWDWNNLIVPKLKGLGFDHRFHQELSLTEPQLAVKAQCDSLLVRTGAIVAMVGIRGTGKTSIAAQIAIERIRYWFKFYHVPEWEKDKRGPAPRAMPWYYKASTLVAKYKSLHADFGSIDGPQLQESFENMSKDCGLLVIDEWHECEDRKLRDRVLVDLIDRFYSSLSDVLIISNQEPKEFATSTNASILSRLGEHGRIIPCKWDSFRARNVARREQE